MPIGVDVAEAMFFLQLQGAGLDVRDGQALMMLAREIKSQDEIMLLTQACAMVDGVYHDIYEALKPGVRESDIVALAHARLFEMGSGVRRGDQLDRRRTMQPASARVL